MISRIEEAWNGHLQVITSRCFVEWDGWQELTHPDSRAQLGVPVNGIFHVFEDRRGGRWSCTSAEDIAVQLFISEETVKAHVKHLMDKLGAKDRTEAVAIALRRGIIHI